MSVAPSKAVDWRKECESSANSLIGALNDKDNWTKVCTTNDVEIYRMSPTGNKMPIFMGSTVIHAPVMAVSDLLSVTERKNEYDEIFVTSTNIEHLDDATYIERHIYKSPCPALISCRDLCMLVHAAVCGDGAIVLLGKSVSHPSCPPVKGYVRAEVAIGGYLLQPLTKDLQITQDALTAPYCKLTYIAQTNIKGRIPLAFTAQMFIKQPLIVSHIRTIVEKEYGQLTEPLKSAKELEYKTTFNMLPLYPDIRYTASKSVRTVIENEDVILLEKF